MVIYDRISRYAAPGAASMGCYVQHWKTYVCNRVKTCGVSVGPLYHEEIRRCNKIESPAVLKNHAIHGSIIDKSDGCVIVGA